MIGSVIKGVILITSTDIIYTRSGVCECETHKVGGSARILMFAFRSRFSQLALRLYHPAPSVLRRMSSKTIAVLSENELKDGEMSVQSSSKSPRHAC